MVTSVRQSDRNRRLFGREVRYGRTDARPRLTFARDLTNNANGQLTAAAYDTAGNLLPNNEGAANESYTYDDNGDRVDSSSPSSSTAAACTTGTGNELLWDGTYSYQYDRDGNLMMKTLGTSGATVRYTWDNRGRLVQVADYSNLAFAEGQQHATEVIQYTYDYLNRRIEETTTASGTTTYDHLVYDGSQPLLEFSGQGTSATVSHRYLDAATIGQVLADDQFQVNSVAGAPLGTIWQLPDNEGTIRDLVWLNHQGSWTTTHQVYNSFGVLEQSDPLVVMGTPPQPLVVTTIFGYAGGIYDPTLGMVQFVDRWYDPNTGRFLSPDPTGFAGGLSNLYCYCGNNPLTETDPTGDQQGYAGSGVVFAAGYNSAPISLTESCPSAAESPSVEPDVVHHRGAVAGAQL